MNLIMTGKNFIEGAKNILDVDLGTYLMLLHQICSSMAAIRIWAINYVLGITKAYN